MTFNLEGYYAHWEGAYLFD